MDDNLVLEIYIDTSSPCSKCVFFKNLKCAFPEGKEKECEQELGTTKGWNTIEYIDINKNVMENDNNG